MNSCPNCGSRYLRPAHARTLKESWDKLRFITPLRCLDCKHRFVARTLTWRTIKYARCPVCLRPDLNGWTGKTYTHPPFWVRFKVSLGAHKFRCEYCRLNFAAFRPRLEVFTFKRWKRMSLPGLPPPAETAEDYLPAHEKGIQEEQQRAQQAQSQRGEAAQ